ncbi:hypothetical protein PVAG01_06431 [Phlyctema vagabunda]|uniref:Uncharacterized protein n=1 Tax=Phlyctema vagabunda TaxID=108571 RepID=A0ABR4PG40_9HELO
MKPNLNKDFDVKPAFNHSFLTAAGSQNESLSWSLSQTAERQAGGSFFATCLPQSIITASDTTEGFYMSETGYIEELDDEGRPTGKMERKLVKTHNFSFAAQDDLWAKVWGKRTELPLLNYQEKWESLPEVPLFKNLYPSAGPLAGSVMSRSPTALHNIVRVKAASYMNSNPGSDTLGGNTACYFGIRRLTEGAFFDLAKLSQLNDTLDYRKSQIDLAVALCGDLDIEVSQDQQVDQFEQFEWSLLQYERRDGSRVDIESSKAAAEVLKRFDTIRGWLYDLEIFDSPLPGQGFHYNKPTVYLSAMLAESPLPVQQIRKKLEDLEQRKLRVGMNVAHSPAGVEILSQPKVKTLRGRLYETAGRLKHRMRSLSPQKRRN